MYLRKLEGQDNTGPVHASAGCIPEDILTTQLARFVSHLLLGDMLCFFEVVAVHMHHFCACSLHDSVVTVSQCITMFVLGCCGCICLCAKQQNIAECVTVITLVHGKSGCLHNKFTGQRTAGYRTEWAGVPGLLVPESLGSVQVGNQLEWEGRESRKMGAEHT